MIYRHYKGGRYVLIGTATHTRTEESLVVYRSIDREGKLWARPHDEFFGDVIVDGKSVHRFEVD
jgi:hypothetical protein